MLLVNGAPFRVLYLCTRNAARSQMAEAITAQQAGARFEVTSAGADPGSEVHPMAIAALAERGIDWSGRHPKSIDDISGAPWDLVITVCDHANEACPILPGQQARVHWGLDDPQTPADFRRTLDELARRTAALIALPVESMGTAALRHQVQEIADAIA